MTEITRIPKHLAIIMDGNGRWATRRKLPRFAGHKAGLDAVRRTIQYCAKQGIQVLTLFAFSSENWRRPKQEVSDLMDLFVSALQREVKKLHKNEICIRFIGDRSRFSAKLTQKISEAESLTQNNRGMTLVIAANYGGQWDILQATQHIAQDVQDGKLAIQDITSDTMQNYLCLADLPYPDLFIRTSGEKRISNFLIWQLAYTELFFTDCYWPDFGEQELKQAFACFSARERRFGCTGDQIQEKAIV